MTGVVRSDRGASGYGTETNVVVGCGASAASNSYAVVVGVLASVTGSCSVAVGTEAEAYGYSVAIGSNGCSAFSDLPDHVVALGDAVAMGDSSYATHGSVAIGYGAVMLVSSGCAVVIGASASMACSTGTVVIGSCAYSVCSSDIGTGGGNDSLYLGYKAGNDGQCSYSYHIAIGPGAVTGGDHHIIKFSDGNSYVGGSSTVFIKEFLGNMPGAVVGSVE